MGGVRGGLGLAQRGADGAGWLVLGTAVYLAYSYRNSQLAPTRAADAPTPPP